mgnify:CR=1 FL=1
MTEISLVVELTVLVLAIFLGFEVISKVPTMLHTPLMSGTNFIHGIVIVGAIMVLGFADDSFTKAIGFVAMVLAMQRMREAGQIKAIPVQDHVAATSVGVVGGIPMLDLAYDEDSRADVDMNIVKTGDGRFIEVQGTAEGLPFSRGELDDLLGLAEHGIATILDAQAAVLEAPPAPRSL